MKTLRDVKAGDDVLVFDVNGKRRGQPDGGWPGKVTSVGRKVVYVEYGGHPRVQGFRMDTGRSNDTYGHQYARTVEEHAAASRRAEVLHGLRRMGLTFTLSRDMGRGYSTEALERILEVAGQALAAEGE